MARPIWSGLLSVGLVNVPVQLMSAARDLDYHFHQLHEKDGARIEQRRYCSAEDVEVDWEEVARSYDLVGGADLVVKEHGAQRQGVVTHTNGGQVPPAGMRSPASAP